MDGYDFITMVDGKRWGTVVGSEGDYVIVEHGTFRKHRYAVPQSSVEVDDDARQARTTLSGDLIADSPQIDGDFDHDVVGRHYGLAAASDAPPTEGWGGTVADDPAQGAEYQAQQADVDSAVEQRARIREGAGGATEAMPDESPAMLGDRLADVRDDEPRR
jgi:hypothetical protein